MRFIMLSAPTDLHPEPAITTSPALLVILLICVVLAVVLIALAILSTRLKPRPHVVARVGAHSGAKAKDPWHMRVNDVLVQYRDGRLSRDEAFTMLAKVARDYAGHASGHDMAAHTLADISRSPRNPGNRRGLDLLRQTIAALYPPEFADASVNAAAKDATVEQACEWVLRLVERWR